MSQLTQVGGGGSSGGVGDVVGPSSATDNRIASFDSTTGKLIKDSGVLSTAVVVGPASATDNAVARFDATTGKLLQNSVVTVDDAGLFAGANMPSAQVSGASGAGSASAGYLGEYFQASVTSVNAITLATTVVANLTTLSLGPGDWVIDGIVGFGPGAVTGTNFTGGVTTASATVGQLGDNFTEGIVGPSAAGSEYRSIPGWRVLTAASVTAYLVAKATFSVGPCKAFGRISARRMR